MAEPKMGPIFIAGDQPVTEEAIKQKLEFDGWSNIQIVRDGRFFVATATKDELNGKFVVDRLTGRLRASDNDDDD